MRACQERCCPPRPAARALCPSLSPTSGSLSLCPSSIPTCPKPGAWTESCSLAWFYRRKLKNKAEKVMRPRPPQREPGGTAKTRTQFPIQSHALHDTPRVLSKNVTVSSTFRSAFCSFHSLIFYRTKPGHQKINWVLVSGPACPVS